MDVASTFTTFNVWVTFESQATEFSEATSATEGAVEDTGILSDDSTVFSPDFDSEALGLTRLSDTLDSGASTLKKGTTPSPDSIFWDSVIDSFISSAGISKKRIMKEFLKKRIVNWLEDWKIAKKFKLLNYATIENRKLRQYYEKLSKNRGIIKCAK